MPDPALLETFESPSKQSFYIEHVHEEFTSVCPHHRAPRFRAGDPEIRTCRDMCIELKSLKLYYQSFRNEGAFYEAVTNQIRDDLRECMKPRLDGSDHRMEGTRRHQKHDHRNCR